MRFALVAIAALALLPACKSRVGGGRPQAAACVGGAAVPPGPGGQARTVTGSLGFVRWLDDGSKVPVQPTGLGGAVSVLVPITGGYQRFPGTLRANGSFSVEGVPPGRYLLAQDHGAGNGGVVLVEHEASALDIATHAAGRPDVAYPQLPTSVEVTVAGLDPWTPGDAVFVHSSNAQLAVAPWGADYGGVELSLGLTSAARTMSWEAELPVGALGDVLFAYQLAAQKVEGGELLDADYQAAAGGARLGSVTLTDGQTGAIGASLAKTASASLDLDVRHSLFAELAGRVGPEAQIQVARISVGAVPHAPSFPGPFGQEAPLLLLAIGGETDWTATGLAWSRNHGEPWKEIRRATFTYGVPLAAHGAAPIVKEATVEVAEEAPAGPASSWLVAPVVSPPAAPMVAGRDALSPQAGVCTTPEITWSAPGAGSPTSYVVAVFRLVPDAGETRIDGVLTATVRGNRLRVPPGLLQAGRTYAATITAFQAPWDVVDRPDARGFPYASATVVTAPFQP